jgi:hypothetical protein
MRSTLLLLFLIITALSYAQDSLSNYRAKKVVVQDTIIIDTISINPAHFKLKDTTGVLLDSTLFTTDFKRGLLFLSEEAGQRYDSVTIEYLRYPDFLTKDYFSLDRSIIVEGNGMTQKLISLREDNSKINFTPFDGLNTAGSITRGITVGNNQNAVVNSELDLQITGQLNEKVAIRASIQDTNIPTQEGGYSQSIDEFDQIFIELFSDDWNIRAGDVDLQHTNSYFGQFTKKVQGISLAGKINNEDGSTLSAFAAGALVRGVFSQSNFIGQEGNQGPYKLVGPNGELFVLIVSGSERVHVNGLLLERGENNDYVIDYNAGEIKFNPTYPITSNMRIQVEYQFTERNYTRFIGYGGGNYTSDKLDLGTYVYSESDAKNQPLQQNLSEEQVAILQAAGDDMDAMTAPSAVADEFSENRTLYRMETVNGVQVFVYSTNPEDELFNVRFTLVGPNMGNYIISPNNAINRVFEFVAPIDGVPQGNYEPIIQLNAPTKLQIGGINGSYHPSEKTTVNFEIAGSKNDLNLFSTVDDGNNDGFAAHLTAQQRLLTTADTLTIDGFGALDFINQNFTNVERLYNVEFNRDWNLFNPKGNQRYVISGVNVASPTYGTGRYEFQNLDFSENFSGTRHVLSSNIRLKKLNIETYSSYLKSRGDSIDSKFFRLRNRTAYSFKKAWLGGKLGIENNQVKGVLIDSLRKVSQAFKAYEFFTGVGDSTKVFAEVGYQYRVNDSVRGNALARVNTSNTYYLKSRPISSKTTQLSVFANYRFLKSEDPLLEDEKSFSARVLYNQSIFNNAVRLNTVLESNNGVLPQQEFTFVKVEPGQGVFTWNDYNNNGVQELEEFEVAQFQDEAEYVRVLLPNQIFLRVRENKFSQILTLNPQSWSQKEGIQKVLSKFYNQTSYGIDRKVRRENDGFSINPFVDGGDNQLGLTLNFRNALFFNRGKQRYTTNYTYISTSTSNLISLGLQENKLKRHQVSFTHKFWELWLVNLQGGLGSNESISQNFSNRNYELDTYDFNPKLSYLYNPQTRFDVFYEFANKDNVIGDMERLNQQKLGFSFSYSNAEKISMNGEFKYISNDFSGSAFSPVAYQLLEGLQPGNNFTWRVLFQKRITKYLDVNLSYFGRKSETSNAIHTGNIQLKAFF